MSSIRDSARLFTFSNKQKARFNFSIIKTKIIIFFVPIASRRTVSRVIWGIDYYGVIIVNHNHSRHFVTNIYFLFFTNKPFISWYLYHFLLRCISLKETHKLMISQAILQTLEFVGCVWHIVRKKIIRTTKILFIITRMTTSTEVQLKDL